MKNVKLTDGQILRLPEEAAIHAVQELGLKYTNKKSYKKIQIQIAKRNNKQINTPKGYTKSKGVHCSNRKLKKNEVKADLVSVFYPEQSKIVEFLSYDRIKLNDILNRIIVKTPNVKISVIKKIVTKKS